MSMAKSALKLSFNSYRGTVPQDRSYRHWPGSQSLKIGFKDLRQWYGRSSTGRQRVTGERKGRGKVRFETGSPEGNSRGRHANDFEMNETTLRLDRVKGVR